MIDGRRVLVVVPARGGSKGVVLKNLQPVAGRPLIALVGEVVAALDWVDRAVVSTDHLVIRQAALDSGLEAPFMRPESLAGDRVGDVDVLTHALEATEADDGAHYEIVVMLQPTSPLRRADQVTAAVEKLTADNLDAVWTVSPTDSKFHPLKQLTLDEHGRLDYFDARAAGIIARQQLKPVYHRNGVAYALTRECLLGQGSLIGRRSGAVVIAEPQISIDTEADLRQASRVMADSGAGRGRAPKAPRPRSLVVDIDGVVATAVAALDYASAGPVRDNIARVNALYDAGCRILLYTARGSATGKDWSEVTSRQMRDWGVRYHELRFGKPPADYYIDDRQMSLPQVLALCGLEDPVTKT